MHTNVFSVCIREDGQLHSSTCKDDDDDDVVDEHVAADIYWTPHLKCSDLRFRLK